jgi:hypothetical protein
MFRIELALDLIEFINQHDPRYTAELFLENKGVDESTIRVLGKARDESAKNRLFFEVEHYTNQARQEVKDPVFLSALDRWQSQRLRAQTEIYGPADLRQEKQP